MHKRLFTPGPTQVRAEILKELATPQIHHRTPEFSELYADIQVKLQTVLSTQNAVLLYTSSSTGAMESAVTNLVSKRCLNLVNGAFSKRWHEITAANGVPCDVFELPWNIAIKPEMVDEQLATGKYDAVTLVYNETSTGLMNPLEAIAEVVAQYPDVFLLVDAVSDRVIERSKTVPSRSYYFNIPLMYKSHLKNQTPSTPSIPHMYALNAQLNDMLSEGMEKRFARHAKMASIVQAWAKKHFDIFPEERYWSQTLTSVVNTTEIDVPGMIKTLADEYNLRIANGYGDIKNKTFRIAHMGDTQVDEIQGLLKAIESVLGL